MDFSAILAYKSLFFLNRANNSAKQAKDGKKCTATANAARCTITASQSIVPLFAVSKCLASTSASPTIKDVAKKVSTSNLEKIARSMTADTTKSALKGISKITKILTKLGIVGNISYAAAKCMDAKEEDKTKIFMEASGNCAGMYLFEHLYSKAVKDIAPENITKSVETASKKIPAGISYIKSVKPTSVLLGVGFVAASLFGCWAGERFGNTIYTSATPKSSLKLEPALASVPANINTIA